MAVRPLPDCTLKVPRLPWVVGCIFTLPYYNVYMNPTLWKYLDSIPPLEVKLTLAELAEMKRMARLARVRGEAGSEDQ